MIAVSAEFLAAVRSPHGLALSATAYPPSGAPITDLPIMSGSVTIDRTADNRRGLDLTLAPLFPFGHPLQGEAVYPMHPGDPINVYGTEIVVQRGVRFANGAVELAQLGVFRVESVERDEPAGGVQITGWDRSKQVMDQRFIKPRKFTGQNAVTLIETLISEVYPSAVFDVSGLSTAATTIPKHTVDRDRWAECQRVAQILGGEVFADEQGTWVIQDTPDPSSSTPVWDIDNGADGVRVEATNSVTREGAPSVVVVIGEPKNGDNPVYSRSPHGWDLNTQSPTYAHGPFGEVARFYSSQYIHTQAQADRVADKQLADHLGASRSVSFGVVPNPALDAGDAVNIHYTDGTVEKHIIDVLTIPLDEQTTMTGETRVVDWSAE